MKTKHISECRCGTHLIQTEYDDQNQSFHIDVYTYGEKDSIWERFKYCVLYLLSGRVYNITLDSKEANKLSQFIIDRTDEE